MSLNTSWWKPLVLGFYGFLFCFFFLAVNVYFLSSLCAGLWASNFVFVFFSLQVMNWQKPGCRHHMSEYYSKTLKLSLQLMSVHSAKVFISATIYFMHFKLSIFFCLKFNNVWLDLSGRWTNNDLLSLDPFSPNLAAGSSSSVSSSAGNTTAFYLDTCVDSCSMWSPLLSLSHTKLLSLKHLLSEQSQKNWSLKSTEYLTLGN